MSFSNQYADELIFDFYFLDGSIKNFDIRNITTRQYNLPISDSPIVKIVYKGGIIEDETLLTFGYYPKEIDNNFSFITKVNIEDKIE
jgi:hypothetical protein